MYYVYEKNVLPTELANNLTRLRTEFNLTDAQIDTIAKHAHRIIISYYDDDGSVTATLYIKDAKVREKLALELLPRALNDKTIDFNTYSNGWSISWRTDVPDDEIADLLAQLWVRDET